MPRGTLHRHRCPDCGRVEVCTLDWCLMRPSLPCVDCVMPTYRRYMRLQSKG
jgi:hypothetical protein